MTANRIVPAAQYLRMSTEHQQYSLENQSSAIKAMRKPTASRLSALIPTQQRAE